ARGADDDFAAARLDAHGTLDTAVGFLGTQSLAFGLGRQDIANAMAIDQRGHIVLAGWTQIDGGNFDMAVARLNFDGSIDTNFGDFGRVRIPFNLRGALDDGAYAMAIDQSNNIVLGGGAQYNGFDYDMAVARLQGDPLIIFNGQFTTTTAQFTTVS